MNKQILVYRFFLLLTLSTFFLFKTVTSRSIQLFLKPAPYRVQESVKKEINLKKIELNDAIQKLEKLNKISTTHIGKKLLKNRLNDPFKKLLPKISGFIGLYGGYVDFSNSDGIISFPLLHKESKIYLVITPKINLVNIYGNTISHRKIIAKTPYKIYLFEKKEDENKIIFWRVSEQTSSEQTSSEQIRADKKINSISIILLTKPKNIVVPQGDFIATKHTNLIIPNIFVVGNIDKAKTLLDFLDIKRFFEQIDRKEKIEQEKILLKLIQNN